MLDVMNNGLVADDPAVDAPEGSMNIQLRAHQQTVLKAMEDKERNMTGGYDISGERLYGDYAILGDSVGVGKSYMVLGHIARVMWGAVPPITSYTEIQKYSSGHLFSLKNVDYTDISEAGCLIVVPHSLSTVGRLH